MRSATTSSDHSNGSDLRTVVAAGGDGTAALVANVTPPEAALSVFPLGTENLLAKYLGFGGHAKNLPAAIAAGRTARLDAGQLTDDRQPARLFLLMAGMGFDAEVVHRLHGQRRGHISHLSYAVPICSTIRDYGYPLLRITLIDDAAADVQREWTARWAFVFNLPMYASRLAICPQAIPFDGQLDLVTFQAGSLGQGLRVLAYVLLGQSQRLAGAQFCAGRFFRIEAADPAAEVRYQVDGDPGGTLPVEIRVLPQRLRVLVPPDWEPHWARGAARASR